MQIAQLVELTQAKLIRGNPASQVARISIDTRTLCRGDCFIALPGLHYDGHNFLDEAARLGASAAIVSDPLRAANAPPTMTILAVPDTLKALHKIAAHHRRQLPSTTRVIAISGACGKTTTKDMIASVLSQRFNVVKTQANNNNHIGVPMALLALTAEQDYGVVELGSNHPGEMRVLTDMVRPDIAVVTNIGLAHVEFLGDEAGVAQEEGTPLDSLPADGNGVVVLNADEDWYSHLRQRTRTPVLAVRIENAADVKATDIVTTWDPTAGEAGMQFHLNIPALGKPVLVCLKTLGRHQVYNALEAAAVGYFAGLTLEEIRHGLENVVLPKMRMELQNFNGVWFVNDCYNANVPSMRAALLTLQSIPCHDRKIAVLGDMLELGQWTEVTHRKIGALAAGCGLESLITVGPAARWIAEGAVEAGMRIQSLQSFSTAAEAAEPVHALVRPGDVVLIKGSRGMGLDRILKSFS